MGQNSIKSSLFARSKAKALLSRTQKKARLAGCTFYWSNQSRAPKEGVRSKPRCGVEMSGVCGPALHKFLGIGYMPRSLGIRGPDGAPPTISKTARLNTSNFQSNFGEGVSIAGKMVQAWPGQVQNRPLYSERSTLKMARLQGMKLKVRVIELIQMLSSTQGCDHRVKEWAQFWEAWTET